jgi:hypothetical protein
LLVPDCSVQRGKRAILLSESNVRLSGETHTLSDCDLKSGSVVRIYGRNLSEEEADAIAKRWERKRAVEEQVDVETSSEVVVSEEIEQVANAAAEIGGEYAPVLAIVLALLAVLGGKKAWSFYSERAEQKHELELKKLEMQRDMAGAGAASPPPCQAVQAKIEASLEETKTRVASIEKRLLVIGDDFDSEDIERKVKRLQKAVRDLQDDSSV